MKIKLLIYIGLSIILSGCWPNDESIEPVYFPYNTKLVSIPYSMYDYQVYYNLNNNEIASYNHKSEWDIGFECTATGEHIILNSANILEVANLGVAGFASIQAIPPNTEFYFDASSGNIDSLAINGWVNTGVIPYEYSDNLYILAKKEELDYVPYRKLKFIDLTPSSFTMLIGNIDATTPDTFIIEKDASVNFVKYKIIDEVTEVPIEPEKNSWDIQLTQYSSILFTDDGIATKYSVRGVLINPNLTTVGKWFINNDDAKTDSNINSAFMAIDSTYIDSVEFKNELDVIGWEWKEVTIDEGSNTALYKADPRQVFIIKNSNNQYFKLHFISFYNNMGVKGYPRFEFAEI